jgi:alpha-tubulin suppressor-like RCC1 family protein
MKRDSVLIWGRKGGNVKTSKNISSIAAGECHTLIATANNVYSSGANGWGQLGLGNNDEIMGVQKIENLDQGTVKQVSGGR